MGHGEVALLGRVDRGDQLEQRVEMMARELMTLRAEVERLQAAITVASGALSAAVAPGIVEVDLSSTFRS